MPEALKRYWDSTVFLALIKNEANRADTCEAIVNDAREGRCLLYTSVITLVEVIKTKRGQVQVGKDVEDQIARFFQNDFIRLIPVSHAIGTRARRLIWDFPFLGTRDALHLATALETGIDVLEHYDDDDFGKVAKRVAEEKLPGFPEIRHPKWIGQTELSLPAPPAAPVAAPTPQPGPTSPQPPSN